MKNFKFNKFHSKKIKNKSTEIFTCKYITKYKSINKKIKKLNNYFLKRSKHIKFKFIIEDSNIKNIRLTEFKLNKWYAFIKNLINQEFSLKFNYVLNHMLTKKSIGSRMGKGKGKAYSKYSIFLSKQTLWYFFCNKYKNIEFNFSKLINFTNKNVNFIRVYLKKHKINSAKFTSLIIKY